MTHSCLHFDGSSFRDDVIAFVRSERSALLDPNLRVRLLAERGIVPRDHWDLLVPASREENPHD